MSGVLPGSRLRPAAFDGRLVWWEDGGGWKVGAENCPDGAPSGDGAIYAWLDREPLGVELYAALRQCDGDLDRASELWVERYGGRFGYRPARFSGDVLVFSV